MSFLFGAGVGGSAIPDSVVEDFEDGNIDGYGGDTGAFNVQSGTVYNGTYALEETFTGNTGAGIADTSITVNEDQIYQAALRPVADKRGLWVFMAQSTNRQDGYTGGYDASSGEFYTSVGNKSVSLNLPQFVIVEFEKQSNGTVNFRLLDTDQNELASISGTDDSYSSGGLGVDVNNIDTTDGGNVVWDYCVTE